MALEVEILTSKGFIHCVFRRDFFNGEPIVDVDMWQSQSMGGVDNAFTSFRAGVYMHLVGEEYKIIQPYRNAYTNEFWREMEKLLSNTIVVNE